MLEFSKIGIYTPTQCPVGTLHFSGGKITVDAAKLFGGRGGVGDRVGVWGWMCVLRGEFYVYILKSSYKVSFQKSTVAIGIGVRGLAMSWPNC